MWTDLFDTLPDEILEELLKSIPSPRDLSSLAKASIPFSVILHPQKPHFLFADILPFIVPYLQKSDLLTTRLVCGEWRSSTDAFLERAESFSDEMCFRKYSFWPKTSRSITDFLAAFGTQKTCNPFPGRRAAFGRIRREAPSLDYWVNVRLLLQDFGSELCDLRLDFEDIPYDRFVGSLSDCLGSLPRVKRLQIVYFGRPSSSTEVQHLRSTLFPNLPILEHLDLNGTYPTPFLHSFVSRYSATLKVLKLHQPVPADLVLPALQNLESLQVSSNSTPQLAHIIPANKTLSQVSISIYLPEPQELGDLFTHLHPLRDTLRTLHIQFNNTPNQSVNPPILSFPLLTSLKILNAPAGLLNAVDTLSPRVQSLEFSCLEKGNEPCGVFKICGHPANQLYDSNIWTTLPNLQSCKLSCYQLFSGREVKYSYSRTFLEYIHTRGG